MKSTFSLKKQDAWQGYLFILPWLAGFLLLTAGPLLFSLYASFTNYDMTSQMSFVGLFNFKQMFFQDSLFWVSLFNTLFFVAFSVPLTTIGAMLLAILLNQGIPGQRVFRTIFYLPAVLSGVGVYLLWMQLLSPASGLVNTLLGYVGIAGPAWLSDPEWTKPALVLMKMWSVGGSMLFYLAALQNVPRTLYEVGSLEGANAWHRFRYITFPLITPVVFFDLITSFIGAFQIFSEAYVMSEGGKGGPVNSLLFYNLRIWQQAFESYNMGYAMAMSWFLFIIILLLTLFNFKWARRWVHYEGEQR